MIWLPRKTLERSLLAEGYDCIIGVDEVGMGCLAGPVVVCAMLVAPTLYDERVASLAGLRDSKLLSPRQRELFAVSLKAQLGVYHFVATISAREVDRSNVLVASQIGMRKALKGLLVSAGSAYRHPIVLVDGNKAIPGFDHPQQTVVGGDRRVFAIAGASVLAKVHRDAYMVRCAKRFPGYGFEVHKGYGTALHRERIATMGPCPLHRLSFSLT